MPPNEVATALNRMIASCGEVLSGGHERSILSTLFHGIISPFEYFHRCHSRQTPTLLIETCVGCDRYRIRASIATARNAKNKPGRMNPSEGLEEAVPKPDITVEPAVA